MKIQEAISRTPSENEIISKEVILKYLASRKTPVDYNDFINNRLFKRPMSYTRYRWRFYDKDNTLHIDIKNGKCLFGLSGERQSAGVFDSNGILLFDGDIVYHKQTNLFYVIKKKKKHSYLCREGEKYVSTTRGILRHHHSDYNLEDLVVSQDFKFVAAYNDEIKFHDRYISLSDTVKTIY